MIDYFSVAIFSVLREAYCVLRVEDTGGENVECRM
jgi:hypothetical protein